MSCPTRVACGCCCTVTYCCLRCENYDNLETQRDNAYRGLREVHKFLKRLQCLSGCNTNAGSVYCNCGLHDALVTVERQLPS